MSNYKTEATAAQLASDLATITGLNCSWAYLGSTPLPTVSVGTPSVAGSGGLSLVIEDQYAEVDKGFDALPGFPIANVQPVYTGTIAKVIVESEGFVSFAWTNATIDVVLAGVVAGDTVLINGYTFTARAVPAVPYEFAVGLNDEATSLNLIAEANLRKAITGVVASDGGVATVTLTSLDKGAIKNLIPVRDGGSTHFSVGAGDLFLKGGTGGKAVGWYQFTSVIATDALAIAGTTFTAIVGPGPTAVQFVVGANDLETATNAAAAINAHTTVNKLVTAIPVAGDSAANAYIYLIAKQDGALGNLITTTDADATIVEGSGTLLGGGGAPQGVVGGPVVWAALMDLSRRGMQLDMYFTDLGTAPTVTATSYYGGSFTPNRAWAPSALV